MRGLPPHCLLAVIPSIIAAIPPSWRGAPPGSSARHLGPLTAARTLGGGRLDRLGEIAPPIHRPRPEQEPGLLGILARLRLVPSGGRRHGFTVRRCWITGGGGRMPPGFGKRRVRGKGPGESLTHRSGYTSLPLSAEVEALDREAEGRATPFRLRDRRPIERNMPDPAPSLQREVVFAGLSRQMPRRSRRLQR